MEAVLWGDLDRVNMGNVLGVERELDLVEAKRSESYTDQMVLKAYDGILVRSSPAPSLAAQASEAGARPALLNFSEQDKAERPEDKDASVAEAGEEIPHEAPLLKGTFGTACLRMARIAMENKSTKAARGRD